MKEYNPIGCDHKKDNGFSAWDIQSGEIGSGPEMDVDVHVMVCKKCGDIRVVGRRWDGKKDKADHFDEIFHVYHEDAIDAIIKQANFFNEEVKWQKVTPLPANDMPTAFQNEPVNFLLSNALRHLTQDQQRQLCNALQERLPIPASIEQEAERLYPYMKQSEYLSMDVENVNRVADYKRSAHITCARQYMDTIEKLKAKIVSLEEEIALYRIEK